MALAQCSKMAINTVVNTPWAINQATNGVGQGFTWTAGTAATILKGLGNAILFSGRAGGRTLEGLGNGALWTLKSSGRVITVTAGAVATTLGYPIAVVALPAGVITGIISLGPCWAATNTPSFMDRIFNPIESSARLADAALCPAFSAGSGILLTLGALGLLLGRLGRAAF